MQNAVLTALVLFALLGLAPLAVVAEPGVAPAEPTAATHSVSPVADDEPAATQAPDFATWLAGEPALPAPAFELAAACRTCAQCPSSHPFCCILASGCASCTTRPTVCANPG